MVEFWQQVVIVMVIAVISALTTYFGILNPHKQKTGEDFNVGASIGISLGVFIAYGVLFLGVWFVWIMVNESKPIK
jgi:hypothetical protein